jgi:hypothetical protein
MGKLFEFLVPNMNIFCTHSSMQNLFSKLLKLDINIVNECCIGIKAKASALQQQNSNALYMCASAGCILAPACTYIP